MRPRKPFKPRRFFKGNRPHPHPPRQPESSASRPPSSHEFRTHAWLRYVGILFIAAFCGMGIHPVVSMPLALMLMFFGSIIGLNLVRLGFRKFVIDQNGLIIVDLVGQTFYSWRRIEHIDFTHGKGLTFVKLQLHDPKQRIEFNLDCIVERTPFMTELRSKARWAV